MKRKSACPVIFLAVVTVITFIPIIVTIVYSFNASRISSVWEGMTLGWYRELFRDREIFRALKNSILLAVLSCLVSAVIGTLGALGTRRLTKNPQASPYLKKLNGIVTYVARLPIMIPEIILGMVYLAVFSFMDLPFGMLTLVIAHTSFCIPYIFIMVSDRLIGLDPQIEEAARDLGAKPLRVFFDITIPQILPALLSGLLLSFAMSFDDVVISIFVTGPGLNTLPIKIYSSMKSGVSPKINALASIMAVATAAVLIIRQVLSVRRSRRQECRPV